jgi:ABC-2 type transport system permease protein
MASMTTPSNAVPESLDSQRIALAVLSTTRPLYWSIRRELWENRSIYVAPLAVAVVGLLGFSISLIGLPRSMRELTALDPAHQRIMLAMPYSHAAWLLILTAFVVGMFYSLDALHGERRDRSILFWKSLPVSDLTTVLSKASIPLVVLPLLVFAIIVILQLIMLLLSTVVLLISDAGARTLWTNLPLFQMQFVLLYGLAVLALWHAPLYVWLLLVSGWARRATFLWAVLPPLAIGVFEKTAFHTSYFGSLLHDRLSGFAADAFAFKGQDGVPVDPHFMPLTQLTPGKFLATPGLWIGLGVAAIFLAAAVRLRRYREPI